MSEPVNGVRCSSCGSENRPTGRFCRNCGEVLAEADEATASVGHASGSIPGKVSEPAISSSMLPEYQGGETDTKRLQQIGKSPSGRRAFLAVGAGLFVVLGAITAVVVYRHYGSKNSHLSMGGPSVVFNTSRLQVAKRVEPIPTAGSQNQVSLSNIPKESHAQNPSSSRNGPIEVRNAQTERVLINGETQSLSASGAAGEARKPAGSPQASVRTVSKELASAQQLPAHDRTVPPPAHNEPAPTLEGSTTAGSSPPPQIAPALLPYTGPASGAIIWSGRVEKGGTFTIYGNSVSSGSMQGALPGLPVMIDVDTSEFAVAEAPSPSNGWKRLVIRSKKRRHSVVTIKWRIVQ